MRIQTNRQVKDNLPAKREAAYHIDDSAVVHITRILRNMYEDPVRAVVREYMANAVDAHQHIGQTKAIEVDTPTRMVPTFRVRDFGSGLSVQEVEKLLLGYGASGEEKRKSQKQIGGFGIGCKCAFAIADSFTYTSWHDGVKQIWVCQLDDHDMGQAKLISTIKSPEPTGLMVEIPVSNAQLELFKKHIEMVPTFFRIPVKLDGTLVVYRDNLQVTMEGHMNGQLKGSEWMFYNLEDAHIDDPLVIIMGDLWYPVDISYIDTKKESRLMKILDIRGRNYGYRASDNGKGDRCAIRAPIGTFSLAPTRESLQYDNATRRALKQAIKEIEDNLQDMAQKTVDKQVDIWTASAKALELQSNLMYQTGQTKDKQPAFSWKDTEYPFHTALGIKAEEDTTGAVVTLAVRDLRDRANPRYGDPSQGNLRVRHFVLNAKGNQQNPMPENTIHYSWDLLRDLREFFTPTGSFARQVRRGWTWLTETTSASSTAVKSTVVFARTLTGGTKQERQVLEYVFPFEIPVFTMDEKPNVEFYTRRYLTSEAMYAPSYKAFALVVQGTAEERKAFFTKYPWLNKHVKALPLLKVHRVTDGSGKITTATGRSFKSAKNMFKFKGSSPDYKRPSDCWAALERPPKGDINYVYLERFIPNDVPPLSSKVRAGLSPHSQFQWLMSMQRVYALLNGMKKPGDVYGFRFTQRYQTPPDNAQPLPEVLDNDLRNWFNPSKLNDHKPHGFHVLARFGPFGFFRVMGLEKDFLPVDINPSGVRSKSWHRHTTRRDFLTLVQNLAYKDLVLQRCAQDSTFRKFVEVYYKLTALDRIADKDLNEYQQTLSELHRCMHTSASPKLAIKLDETVGAEFATFIQPLKCRLDAVWKTYPMFDLMGDVPETTNEMNALLDYITVVDKHNKGEN